MTTLTPMTLTAKNLTISEDDRRTLEQALELVNHHCNKIVKSSAAVDNLRKKLAASRESIPDLERSAARFNTDAETKLHAMLAQSARISHALEEAEADLFTPKQQLLSAFNEGQLIFERVCAPLVEELYAMFAEVAAPFYGYENGCHEAKYAARTVPAAHAFIRGFYMPFVPFATEPSDHILRFARAFAARIERVLEGGEVWQLFTAPQQ